MKYIKTFENLDDSDYYLNIDRINKLKTTSGKNIKNPNFDNIKSELLKIDISKQIKFYKVTETDKITTFRIVFSDVFKNVYRKYNMDFVLNFITFIYLEQPLNRIHFSNGISSELRGLGIGNIIYKEFIKHIGGYATSASDSTADAQLIWNKLLKSNEYYNCILPSSVIIFDKKLDISKIESLLNEFLSSGLILKFDISEDLKSKFKHIEKYIININDIPNLIDKYKDVKPNVGMVVYDISTKNIFKIKFLNSDKSMSASGINQINGDWIYVNDINNLKVVKK